MKYPCRRCKRMYCKQAGVLCGPCAAKPVDDPPPMLSLPDRLPERTALPMIVAGMRVLAQLYREMAKTQDDLADLYEAKGRKLNNLPAMLPGPVGEQAAVDAPN